ncbi:Hypothetical predicted protein [Paramuricea clavata]|uniref:Uncharacterized protein n=1 Tax=Paramuricea clavata TaxID=317549 RepID=A0A7D9L394_PARCT|nr:Hypothetical predicted protein [Paramuricea clavata]
MACTTRRLIQFNLCKKCTKRWVPRFLTTESQEIPLQLEEYEFEDMEYSEQEILYPHHIPTTWFQKGLLAVGSGLAAFFDPKRDG